MTKKELLKFLEPFDQETEIITTNGNDISITVFKYEIRADGNGYIILQGWR